MTRFDVTYEIFNGDDENTDNAGFVAEWIDLREAIDLVTATESNHCERVGIEASDSCTAAARWFTVYNGNNWIDGTIENRSLHIPHHVTGASRRRIARLLGVRVG